MRNFTIESLKRLTTAPLGKRRPEPFPGDSPTRVAWDIEIQPWKSRVVTNRQIEGERPGVVAPQWTDTFGPAERIRYIGKPCRYRAQEFWRLASSPTPKVLSFWSCEFDAGGILATERFIDGRVIASVLEAYSAYHPQRPGSFSIAAAFTRPVFIKRIGKFPTYSFHQKLSQEKIDAFYAWYEATFERKLKRPKQKPAIFVPGGFVEVNEEA